MIKLDKILNNVECETIQGFDKDFANINISDICTDTRDIKDSSVFICLKGAKFDSHEKIKEIISSKISALVVENISSEDLSYIKEYKKDLVVLKAENTRKALSVLSINYFEEPHKKLKLIALTGTKGKTTTSFMIKSIIETYGKKCGLIGTTGVIYGKNHIEIVNTTPGSYDLNKYLHDMAIDGIEYVVMEISSQAFKLDRVYGLEFEYGVFLNISPDHIGADEHENYEEYLSCKMEIIKMSKNFVLNVDSDDASTVYNKAKSILDENKIITYGINSAKYDSKDVNFVAENLSYDKKKLGLRFNIKGDSFEYHIPLIGRYNVYNALAAISVARLIGISDEKISESLSKITIPGRCEIVYKNDDFIIMVDYAHNAIAMENLLSTLREFEPARLVVLFGCGGNRSKDRRYGMGKVGAKYADLNILTADNSRFEKTTDIINDIKSTLIPAGGNFVEIEDRRDAIRFAIENAKKGDLIAVIGKGHEPYNEVNGTRTHFLDSEEILKIISELKL